MSFIQLVFYAFSFLAIVGGLMVITSKNPVRAVLFLVFTFFCTAGIWMLLQAEFLSIILVLVYVGAVMVLFLFVVMMLDIEAPKLKSPFVKSWPLGLAVAAIMLYMMLHVIGKSHFGLEQYAQPAALSADYSQVKVLGNLLYSDYLLPFEIAGVILLVGMIAAIGLTFRGSRTSKSQQPGLQVQVRKADRLRIIKMAPEKGEAQ